MNLSLNTSSSGRDERGIGLMEIILALLAALILGSILLHVCKIGFAVYRLNAATNGVAEKLGLARGVATSSNQQVSVFFDSDKGIFGLDRNGNGRLDNIESEELPSGVSLSESSVVTFTRKGTLGKGSKEPLIIVSNSRGSRSVSVSALGSVEID